MVYYVHFPTIALEKANSLYFEKKASTASQEKTLINLCWETRDLGDLLDDGRRIYQEITLIVDSIDVTSGHSNLPLQVSMFREKYKKFMQNLSRHKRTAATHVFVIMISPEERASKPYAIPIQCIPYSSLSVSQVQKLLDKVIFEMNSRGMKVAGIILFYSILSYFILQGLAVMVNEAKRKEAPHFHIGSQGRNSKEICTYVYEEDADRNR